MPVVTEDVMVLPNAQNVRLSFTFNTNNPDNITKVTCVNNNPWPIVLVLNWNSKPPTRVTIPASSTQSANPTAAEQADFNSVAVDIHALA